MKIQDLARPGLVALGVAGLAATALLGFAAGVAMSRDPQSLRRAAERAARGTARGLERAALVAAQAREEIADLWAEAREQAVREVDEADFARTAEKAGSAGAAAFGTTEPPDAPPPRQRTPRRRPAGTGKATPTRARKKPAGGA